jgi:hypothetical protein
MTSTLPQTVTFEAEFCPRRILLLRHVGAECVTCKYRPLVFVATCTTCRQRPASCGSLCRTCNTVFLDLDTAAARCSDE